MKLKKKATHQSDIVHEIHPRLVGADVGQLLQRGQLDAGRAARVPARVQEVAGDQRDVQDLLQYIYIKTLYLLYKKK